MTNSPSSIPITASNAGLLDARKKSPQRLVRLLVERRLNQSSAFSFLAWRRNDAMLSLLVSLAITAVVCPRGAC